MSEIDLNVSPLSTHELFRQLASLSHTVGRMEGKIDGFLDKMHDHNTRIVDLDERSRKMENHQFKVAGASGVIALLMGGAVSLVTHFMKS